MVSNAKMNKFRGLKNLRFLSLEDTDGTYAMLEAAGMIAVNDVAKADIIVFNGGRDIGTEMYGETPVARGVPFEMGERDRHEKRIFESNPQTFKLGICRGAQLLNVLNGGHLFQDVNHHHSSHPIVDLETGEVYEATSTHHQMMRPDPARSVVIAVASQSTQKFCEAVTYLVTKDKLPPLSEGNDVEIAWYPHGRSLCIQGHPEYGSSTKSYTDYCLGLIERHYVESLVNVDA